MMLSSLPFLWTVWYHHMFILGFSWQPGSSLLALPFILIIAGFILLRRDRSRV